MKLRSVHDSFQLPAGLSLEEQRNFCLATINRYRQELPHLRRQTTKLLQQRNDIHDEVTYWKEKYNKEKHETDNLKKENEKLKKEIEKLTKTNNRYQIALFDHGNFTHPDSKDKKVKGGQIGHADTNREKKEDYSLWQRKRIFAKTCGQCGKELNRVNATRQKILLDIVINPEVIKLIVESERQWCGTCKQEVATQDNRSLPFTEYGINTFMMVMLLRFKAHASMKNIATILAISNGLTIAKSDVANIGKLFGETV